MCILLISTTSCFSLTVPSQLGASKEPYSRDYIFPNSPLFGALHLIPVSKWRATLTSTKRDNPLKPPNGQVVEQMLTNYDQFMASNKYAKDYQLDNLACQSGIKNPCHKVTAAVKTYVEKFFAIQW